MAGCACGDDADRSAESGLRDRGPRRQADHDCQAEVGGEAITSLDFLPIILYKEIPSLDGSKREVAYLETSTSRLENLDFRSGSATLFFPDPGDDPVARLRPMKIQQALYGTLDDFYPQTIRILHSYVDNRKKRRGKDASKLP